MGLKNRETKVYLKFKNGKFFKTSDTDLTEPFSELEGLLIDVNLKNETYNGMPLEKLSLDIDGGDGVYALSIPFESSTASKLIGFLKTTDLSKEITLVASLKKDGDKEIKMIFVRRGTGEAAPFANNHYTKDNPNGQPKMKKLKSGKWDKGDFLEFFRDVITNEIKPSLTKKPSLASVIDTEEMEKTEDLPF